MLNCCNSAKRWTSNIVLSAGLAGLGGWSARGDDLPIVIHSFSRSLTGAAAAGSCAPETVYTSSSTVFEALPIETYSERRDASIPDAICFPEAWNADSTASAEQGIEIAAAPDSVVWNLLHTITGATVANTTCSGGSMCAAVSGSYELTLTFETLADYNFAFSYLQDTYLGASGGGVANMSQTFSLSDSQHTLVSRSVSDSQYTSEVVTMRLPAGTYTLRASSAVDGLASAVGVLDFRGATSSARVNLGLAFGRICPIVQQAPAPVTICRGENAQFSTVADGTEPFSYRWYGPSGLLVDGPKANGATIAGAADSTLAISNASLFDAGGYICEISNGCVTYTEAALLTISSCCPGDLDNDADVDLSDLGVVLASYGCTSSTGPCAGDIDADGDVDLSDLGVVLVAYGRPCA